MNAKPDIEIVLDNKKLLALSACLILVWGAFFFLGFLEGRRSATEKKVPGAAPKKEFPDPKCDIPFNTYSAGMTRYFLEEPANYPKPTEAQATQIHRLLPKDTRIYAMSRVDVDPPLAFVLHQPRPRSSGKTELTMFRFKRNKADSEDLGAFCFIPDFLIDRTGRVFAGWAENYSGGNGWSNSSMQTLVIEKGEVSFPEIKSASYQIPKDLILDKNTAVLIVLDTRFEFWEGLNHACSPIQQSIFELNCDGVWVDATSRNLPLVEKWIKEDVKLLHEAESGRNKDEIGTAALNLYLDAETAGRITRYQSTIKQALRAAGWVRFIGMIDEATHRKCRLVDLASSGDKPDADPKQTACLNSNSTRANRLR